ncbi:MAG: trypsin-like peptidase domain-containing protein [Planctomycetota bacterium]
MRILTFRFAPIVLLAGVLIGCGGPAPIADQRPSYVPEEQLRSNIFFGSFDENQVSAGSAVIVDGHHLLTNAHVWSLEPERWWVALPPRSKRLLLDRHEDPRSPTATRFRQHEYERVASGDMTHFEDLDALDLDQRENADWALVRTETPVWDEQEAAVLHPPALDPDWSVPIGTELFVVGFSTIFLPPDQNPGEDLRRFESFLAAGPYTLTGTATLIQDQPAIRYSADFPRPGGHSGGGVYLWNSGAEQLELIGIFHSWSQTTAQVTTRVEPFGLSALAFHYTRERDSAALYYAPLAAIAPDLRTLALAPSALDTRDPQPRTSAEPPSIPTTANPRE